MKWFNENESIENVLLSDLANEINNPNKNVQLPTFQRDAVWDEKHVELLWDSILRKFPVGSLLFARTSDYEKVKNATKGLMVSKDGEAKKTNESSDETEFIIIDGQQRSISIALGFKDWVKKDSARLWIDLGNKKTDKDDENYLVRLYVCSKRKPWGLNATSGQIRESLKMLNKDSDLDKKDPHLLNMTWPLRASVPVPFNVFKQAVVKGAFEDWKSLIPDYIPEVIKNQMVVNIDDVKKIAEIVKGVDDYKIPLYIVKKLETIEDLGSAFQRLNKQGVDMTDDDLFFSGLKMLWPESHDLVWKIYDDIETGKFLPPASIVHNVVRLSAANVKPNGRSDVLDLNLKEFKSLIDTNSINENDFFSKVKSYLEKDKKTGRSLYHSYLMKAKKFIQYHPKENPNGIPLPLLSMLNKRVWHTLTAWFDKNRDAEPYDKDYDETRIEMIRYALFDLLYLKGSSSGFMRVPFEIAFASDKVFPGCWIFREMIDRNILSSDFKLYEPDKLNLYNSDNIPVGNIFNNEIALVHWNQRVHLHKWFPDFDPTLYRTTEDLPYDVDHIIAGHHFNMHGIRGTHESFWKKISYTGLASSSGNFRLWPKSLNRSDQDNDLWEKYILGDKDKSINPTDENNAAFYLTSQPFEFKNIGQVREASCISEDDIRDWEKATNKEKDRDWSDDKRVDAFVTVVQNRKARLYENIFTSLNWSEWLTDKTPRPDYLSKDTQSVVAEEVEAIIADISPSNIISEKADSASHEKFQKVIDKIIPDKITWKYCADIFADSIIECNNNGSNKWGVTVYDKMIFLNYGSIAVTILQNNGIDLCLSSVTNETYTGLNESDKGYYGLESAWAQYTPIEKTYYEVWSKLKYNHYQLIQNASQKYKKLREPSMLIHSNEFIAYLETVTGKKLPRPNYKL
jgi:hypothetical protein